MARDDLAGRTAVVTGGSSGIGRACATALAEAGARVLIGDLDELPENTDRFGELGIATQRCDVRHESEVAGLLDRAAEETGQLDILVNNAGIGMVKPISDVSEEDWDNCLDINLKGAFFGCKHAVRHMSGRGGAIVNMASNAGLLPRVSDPVYSISKGALVALTKALALCHAADRIRINAICPGPVGDTRMMEAGLAEFSDREAAEQMFIAASPLANALGRMIDPTEVAAAALYLVSDGAAMVTGTMIAIDGGKALGVPPRDS
ncbi:MAG: SDR family oxidoreductase [Pirellulaceae bacterium]|nr:SDR family oxidoreductase [Pirellulaceae bacterium]